jgi:seryl-tRNA synthetase
MVNFTLPENSYAQLEVLVSEAEDILQALEIPYRVVLLCSGDTSFASAMTYDLEIWAAGEQKWLEVSSCSNFEDFQARRANIRFKRTPNSKPEFVHTLNGSGVATSRLYVSIIENNIQEDGSILIPEALQEYCGFDRIGKGEI